MDKFIRFEKKEDLTINDTLDVYNHKHQYLGWLSYMDEWKKNKQWIFNPAEDSFFTEGCLLEIVMKLRKLNKKVV